MTPCSHLEVTGSWRTVSHQVASKELVCRYQDGSEHGQETVITRMVLPAHVSALCVMLVFLTAREPPIRPHALAFPGIPSATRGRHILAFPLLDFLQRVVDCFNTSPPPFIYKYEKLS